MIIQEFCEDKHLLVKYHRDPNKQESQDFWDAIKIENKTPALLDQKLINDIELYRSRILNRSAMPLLRTYQRKKLKIRLRRWNVLRLRWDRAD